MIRKQMSSSSLKSPEESVNFLYRTMVERDPNKRRVKPVDTHLLQLNFGELDDSSDDSDFRVEEHEDADSDSDNSIASDDKDDNSSEQSEEEKESTEDSNNGHRPRKPSLNIAELIEQARIKQSQARQRIAATTANFPEFKVLICAVCVGDISEQDDEIVECDGCGVSVHEGCYGITDAESVSSSSSSSSTEPWFCDACKAGNKSPECELCPNRGGIFKETDVGKWVHVVCGLYIPGVAFGNVDKLSPVTLFEMPYSKWGAKSCVLCEDERFSRTGVSICCDAGMCKNYFHVTCAQQEGLLSEASPEEVKEIADPFFAYCKLHADKYIVGGKRRNWLALQSRVRQKKELMNKPTPAQIRINKKLEKRKLKYMELKSSCPSAWVPTQKMSRLLNSSPSACRKLIIKSELMDIDTHVSGIGLESITDIRKKWHIAPAFNVEFVSYYHDRNIRMISMQSRLDNQLEENSELQDSEQLLRKRYEQLIAESDTLKTIYNDLTEKALNLWKILDTIGGKKHVLPDILSSKQAKSSVKLEKKFDSRNCGPVALNKCGLCNKSKDQHLLAKCDTCQLYYHLGCLDPPLMRMPKKNKSQGWQCSECDKTDEGENEEEVDPNAPRKLREHIKEPRKFTPPASNESSSSSSSNGNGVLNGHIKSEEGHSLGNRRKVKTNKKRSLVKGKLAKRSLLHLKKTDKNEKITSLSTPVSSTAGLAVSILKKQPTPEKMDTKQKTDKEVTIEITKAKTPSKQSSIKVVVKNIEQSLVCCKCDQSGSKSSLVSCDLCGKNYHFPCLDPPVKKSPKQRGYVWHCEDCDEESDEDKEVESEDDQPLSIPVKKFKKNKNSPLRKSKKKKRYS